MRSIKVVLAGTGTVHRFAVVPDGAIQIALTLPTVGIPKVTVRARIAMWWLKLSPAFTASRFLLTVTGRVEVITITWLTNVRLIPVSTVRAVELILTLVTIDALRVVLAVLTHAASLVVSMDVQRESFSIDFFGVFTLIGMSVTVAWFALERTCVGVLSPFLLLKPGTTFGTLNAARVVLTLARQNARR